MRSLIVSNGKLLVGLDRFAQVRDLYFPHVGLEEHVYGTLRHRIGVYADGAISWLSDDPRWKISIDCEEDALVGDTTAVNEALGVELTFHDLVYNEKPIFLRRITVTNLADRARDLKLYLGHEFQISRSEAASTAYFDPARNALIHYRGQRAFLVAGESDGAPFSDYAVGLLRYGGKEGTFRDAEDGSLSKNAIEHGPVDSVIGFYGTYEAGAKRVVRYWLAAGESIESACALQDYLLKKTPEHLLKTASDYWRAWVNRYAWSFYGLGKAEQALFKKSLLLVRAHVDDGGGIIASADSDPLQHGKDTYAYVWPRDASYAALALDRAGDGNIVERFFDFANAVITNDGYFMHKYLPDRSLGSSWHPWIRGGTPQLPIQEDETALVIYALAAHYRHSRDLEFIENLDNSLMEKAADFMVEYRDATTKLPKPSYDLWEERHGVSTFTAAAVYGALDAAAELAHTLGKTEHTRRYRAAADEVKEGILEHLYDGTSGLFVKLLDPANNATDLTVDIAGAYGVFAFGVLPPEDPRLSRAFEESARRLSVQGGIGRYERDAYYAAVEGVANPWFVTTLWNAEYLIAKAKRDEDLEPVRGIFAWVAAHASPSGVLSEQLSAADGTQVSVAPLMWSHAAYVNAVLSYLDKLEELGICPACNPAP
ncbi:MAG: glycoside hydrolase family 15 protein [Patescibacteria group bacterium]|nr:glycoside hydrolase family 15 protein [Patescibacteria group bacterium]MDE1965874.1 glycoside hydrolase family 15 protein [Patescibacteria group bacterium]